MRSDFLIVQAVVRQGELALVHAGFKIKKSPEIISEAVRQNELAL